MVKKSQLLFEGAPTTLVKFLFLQLWVGMAEMDGSVQK